MSNLKISTRLTLLIGILSMLLIGIGAIGLYGINKSNDALKTVFEDRTIPMGQIADINQLSLNNRLFIAGSLLDPTPEEIARDTAAIEANIAAIDQVWSAYMATVLTTEEARIAKQLALDRTRFVQEGLRPSVAALRAHDLEGAKRIVFEKNRPLYAPVGAGLAALMKLQIDVSKEEYDAAVTRYASIRLGAMASILVGILLVGLLGFSLARSIASQLGCEPGEAANVAQRVGTGDLSIHIELRPGDSSSLMAQLKSMQDKLTHVVANVRYGSEGVSTASTEIASGNHDLSARTENQASALEQTAASMEALSTTVRQNADNAHQANQLAQSASTVAIQGGEVVAQVVDTMKHINDSSKRIFDIISVIDGIAFQTNILALNAAVEAARAGEQGRGFAVVASEVRSLAGRSAAAAREIKALIGASVEQVEQGSTLVNQAGVTMTEVVRSIRRVTDIMGEISAASSEQSQGVSQVGQAVTQIDQATQQNAALVEEMAAAASSLKSQAQELVHTMAGFTLPSSHIALRTRAVSFMPQLGLNPALVRVAKQTA